MSTNSDLSMEKYETIGSLLKRAKLNDECSTELLIKMFEPLFNTHSYLNGDFNEDLKSELYFCFFKCLKKFKINEEYFLEQLDKYKGER